MPPAKNLKRNVQKVEREKRARRERWITIAAVTFFAAIFIAALIFSTRGGQASVGTIIVPEGFARSQVEGNSVGIADAPVKVEEFSDFECSHCRTFWQQSEVQLINDYVEKGLVRFTYTPFPLWEGESHTTAEASFCAMEQGKFWEYHDILFANYDTEHTNVRLVAFARQLNLNIDQFETCFEEGRYRQQIEEGQQRAIGMGVTGTPSFVVNGGPPIDRGQVFQAIERALADAGQ